MRAAWVLVAISSSGCLRDELLPCGDLLCAKGATCMDGRCVSGESLAACSGLADGADCVTSQVPSGVCGRGECLPSGCGNAVTELHEVCDDGNRIAGDGCSADCRAVDRCPPLGTPPHFARILNQPFEDICRNVSLTEDGSELLALCCEKNACETPINQVATGPAVGPLAPITGLGTAYHHPQLVPEGGQLFVVNAQSASATLELHSRDSNEAWSYTKTIDIPFLAQTLDGIGTPTRGPLRRMMIGTGISWYEAEIDDSGIASSSGYYSATTFGIAAIYGNAPGNMSPDGLRMTFTGYFNGVTSIYYTDRPSIDAVFGRPVPLELSPGAASGFLTGDCSRMYFSALESVLYVEQDK